MKEKCLLFVLLFTAVFMIQSKEIKIEKNQTDFTKELKKCKENGCDSYGVFLL